MSPCNASERSTKPKRVTIADYNQCVDLHADGLYRFILKNMRDEDEARDVVQDAFEKVWIKAPEIQAEKAKSYLYTTAYRMMLERLKKKKRHTDIDLTLQIRPGAEQKPEFDLRKVLSEALARLPEIQRSVVMLRDYEGYSYEEIGQITGLNESQVKVYIFRARVTLKNYLVSTDLVV